LLRGHEKDVIATAPFFSNPRGVNVFLPSTSRTGLVDGKLGNEEMSDVGIILVGHGHHDHATDLPHILKMKAPVR
jgi:mRNA degradation ribonuclease J1/J2